MDSLATVSSINPRTSTQRPGDYDTIVFTGFGSWSNDEDDGRHLASVQVSQASDAPYVSILVDGGTESNVNTKPPTTPEP